MKQIPFIRKRRAKRNRYVWNGKPMGTIRMILVKGRIRAQRWTPIGWTSKTHR